MQLDQCILSRIAKAVNQERLWQHHMELAQFGARADGGVNRQALSREDIAARNYIISIAEGNGLHCAVDAIGNLFIRREGTCQDLPPVLTGSHLDSQPAGGKFDGAFGVLAGLEALIALQATGLQTERAIEVVAWTNEEGSRFSPGVMGSSAFIGALKLEEILAVSDLDGIRLCDALKNTLAATPALPNRDLGFEVAAYIEAHIEQGPILESSDIQIGVVSGIQGVRWFEVKVSGAEAHSGTTPMTLRKDAFRKTHGIIGKLQDACVDSEDVTRFTVGRIKIEPNSINTVPGQVTFSIDLRHPVLERLVELEQEIKKICQLPDPDYDISITELLSMNPVEFNAELTNLLGELSSCLGFSSKSMTSGAFHDARMLNTVCPSAMIFIPCEGGISHNPNEATSVEDVAAGTRLLACTLTALAGVSADI